MYAELELIDNSNSCIGIAYFKKMELINFELELQFATKNYIHKLIYHFRNISSMPILLGI